MRAWVFVAWALGFFWAWRGVVSASGWLRGCMGSGFGAGRSLAVAVFFKGSRCTHSGRVGFVGAARLHRRKPARLGVVAPFPLHRRSVGLGLRPRVAYAPSSGSVTFRVRHVQPLSPNNSFKPTVTGRRIFMPRRAAA